MRIKNSHGFTIFELLISTAVFSVILLIVMAGVISFARQFYKGTVINNTQNVTRTAINEISQSIQFSSGSVVQLAGSNGSTQAYCINDKPYFYVVGKQIGVNTQDALVTSSNSCSSGGGSPPVDIAGGTSGLTKPRELLGKNMRLTKFTIIPSGDLQKVSLTVAYGDAELLCVPSGGSCTTPTSDAQWADDALKCRPGAGNQYCGVVKLTSSVGKRL